MNALIYITKKETTLALLMTSAREAASHYSEGSACHKGIPWKRAGTGREHIRGPKPSSLVTTDTTSPGPECKRSLRSLKENSTALHIPLHPRHLKPHSPPEEPRQLSPVLKEPHYPTQGTQELGKHHEVTPQEAESEETSKISIVKILRNT